MTIMKELLTQVIAEIIKANFIQNDSYYFINSNIIHNIYLDKILTYFYFLKSMINLQPSLMTKLIKLRPLKAEDLQSLY